MTDATFIQSRGVRRRMQCSGQVASIIEKEFVTAEQLVEAVETHDDLTEIDGVGRRTAEVIEDWWEVREERERQIQNAEFERTGANTASIYFIPDWSDALGIDDTDTA